MAKIKLENIDLDDIYEFMEHGDVNNAPKEIVEYLDLLDKVRGMIRRVKEFGTKESLIKHLILVDGFSRYLANKLYEDTQNYFHSNTNITKQAWRNIYAEKVENLATAATLSAQSPEDFDRASRILTRAYKMRQLDVPEPPALPKELFEKPIKIYAMDAAFLGEEPINRLELARQIDSMDVFNEKEKELLKQEAGINQIKLFDHESQELRKPER